MDKIVKYKQIEKLVKRLKGNSEKIILIGGCFDILHVGHIEFLEKSKKLGGKLLILLESDKSVKKMKGVKRPINKQKDRAIILSKLNITDYIILLPELKNDDDYFHLVRKIKPDIIAITKPDSNKNKKAKQAEDVNAKLVEVMKKKLYYSTTKILDKE